MKIHVAYDVQGRILTAVSRAGGPGPTVSSADREGVEIADFDVPEDFEGKHLREFLHLVRVDTRAKRLVIDHPKR
jgi:hypothetical protein